VTLLIKGSRVNRLERVVQALTSAASLGNEGKPQRFSPSGSSASGAH
jgi:hypothetical protein